MLARGQERLGYLVDGILGNTLHGELGHCVRDLLQEDRAEAGVETNHNTLLLHQASSATHEPVRERRVRHKPNPGRLERAQENVGNKFGDSGRREVDGCLELPSPLLTQGLGSVDLDNLRVYRREDNRVTAPTWPSI